MVLSLGTKLQWDILVQSQDLNASCAPFEQILPEEFTLIRKSTARRVFSVISVLVNSKEEEIWQNTPKRGMIHSNVNIVITRQPQKRI